MFLIIDSIVLSLIFKIWFYTDVILTHGDWMYLFTENQKEMLTLPYIWNSAGLGQMNLGITMYPITLLWGSLAGFGFGFTERLLYLIPSVLGTYLGSYLLLSKYFKNRYSKLIGSFAYTLNTYFMIARTGHLTLMVGFALSPFILYFFHQFLDKNRTKYLIASILIGILTSYYEFRVFYLASIVIVSIGFYSVFITKIISLRRLLVVFGIFFGLVFLANLFWLLPFKFTHYFSTNEVTGRGLFGSGYMRIDRAFNLFHPFWSGKEIVPFQVENMPFYMWFIPLFAFYGLYVYRKNPVVLFYSLIALIGIFLTKQSGHPFAGIYSFLYNNLPGFSAFREASKFYFLIALGYSVMIAAAVEWIWKANPAIVTWHSARKYIVIFILGLLFIWNTRPILTGEIDTLFVSRTVPSDYTLLKNKIIKDDGFYRTLWIPRVSRWSFYNNNHPSISFVDTKLPCQVNDDCTLILDNNISDIVLDTYGVKYIVVPIQDVDNNDNFFVHYEHGREYYIDKLDKLLYLRKLNLGDNNLAVYENVEFNSHLHYSTSKGKHEVKSTQISPSQYSLIYDSEELTSELHFAEAYHPEWKLRIGNFSWFQSLIQKDYFYPEKYHSKSKSGLNLWKIDKELLSSQQIDDHNVPITIYFAPQVWVNVGIILSTFTVFGLVALLIILMYKDHEK